MTIQENISLAGFTTFRIGGPADYFIVVKKLDEIQQAFAFAKQKNLPVFILGGGSNVLISDQGFRGLVIKIEIEGIIENSDKIIVGAGVNWDQFVAYTVEKGYIGLENLSLIPGTVGAAPVQNIGAYGVEVKDSVEWVEAYDPDKNELVRVNNVHCRFGYRDSVFKTPAGKKYCILHVAFKLKKEGELKTDYRDIAEYIKNNNITEVTPALVRDIVIDIRRKKLPDVAEVGTAGSFFKNPIISRDLYEKLKQSYPAMPHFDVDMEKVKIPAAWILDNVCGFKGYRDGDVGSYQNQALVLVNYGKATATEVGMLAQKMISSVKEKTNIDLEPEVQFI